MTEKSALNATEKVLLKKALRMRGAARRATDLALSQMTGKSPKRLEYAFQAGDDGEPDRSPLIGGARPETPRGDGTRRAARGC